MPPKEKYVSESDPKKFVEIVVNEETRIWRRSPFGAKWHKISHGGHMMLAKLPLRGADYKVLHMLMPSLDNGDLIYINQVSLAKELNVEPSSVGRSIKRLIDLKVIEKLELNLTGRVYRLNPRIAWKGSDNGSHTKAIKDWDSRLATIQ